MTLYETDFTRRIKSSAGPSSPRSMSPGRSRHHSASSRTAVEDVFGDMGAGTPIRTSSPLGKGKAAAREYGDRFIPTRDGSDMHVTYNLLPERDQQSGRAKSHRSIHQSQCTDAEARRDEVNNMFTHVLKEEMFPPSRNGSRPSSPAHQPQPSPSRHARLRKPMTHHTTNIPISPANHPVSSAGHTPLHHHPPPAMYPPDERGPEEGEMSPASTLPPLPLHAPSTPISGRGRAPGAGPTAAHHRAHQSQIALTPGRPRSTSPSPGRKKLFSPPPPEEPPSPATPSKKRLLNFASPSSVRMAALTNGHHATGSVGDLADMRHANYSLSPVGHESQQVLLSPRKNIRQMARTPFKVLDAPELADDFYLNLVSWSASNVLGVGLNSCVYLWHAQSAKVTRLCDLGGGDPANPADVVTGLEWTNKGSTVALGTEHGSVEIWDAEYCKKIRTMSGHSNRVGCLSWNNHILSTGSRDRSILHRDTRMKEHSFRKLAGHHKQEICGLKWNVDTDQLASGGNDNKLFIWGSTDPRPTWRFGEHRAAVKAMAWSPHQRGILASGGGTADRKIRFWNSLTGGVVSEWDTGSQVCNLMWSRNSNEIVSTHGYSSGPVQNQIHIWKYPSMTQVATLTGHTYRVLYLAMSPDGQTIVTGAGDETLRFWNAFELERGKKAITLGSGLAKSEQSNPFVTIR